MPAKNKAKPTPEQPKKRVKRRSSQYFYENIRFLDTMPATAEQSRLLADVLAVWTRFMLDADPTVAGSIYRVLCDAWQVNRAERSLDEQNHDEHELVTRNFHGTVLSRLHELRGEGRGYPVLDYERKESEELTELMRATLDAMRLRVPSASAVLGESVDIQADVDETPASADDSPAHVVDLSTWVQSHPRPVRNLLFAEKQ